MHSTILNRFTISYHIHKGVVCIIVAFVWFHINTANVCNGHMIIVSWGWAKGAMSTKCADCTGIWETVDEILKHFNWATSMLISYIAIPYKPCRLKFS